jgi:small conductance mechanosensitive channel
VDTTDTTATTDQLASWLEANLVLLVSLLAILVLIAVFSPRFVHTAVRRTLESQKLGIDDPVTREQELTKRATTIESLFNSIIRIAVVTIGALVVMGVFNAWGVLAGLGLVLAALTLAGQSIVLDYLMGTIIILEGQFFSGDWIEVRGTAGVSGTVESVGLRRTVVRDNSGTVHSISNGELRIVSNATRLYATAEVELQGVRDEDLGRVITIIDRVGKELSTDPDWAGRIVEAPGFKVISEFNDLGITLKARGLVRAADRWAVSSEIRRRLTMAFLEEGIELNRRGVPPRLPHGPEMAATAQAAAVDPE